jgi:hypothetical protein
LPPYPLIKDTVKQNIRQNPNLRLKKWVGTLEVKIDNAFGNYQRKGEKVKKKNNPKYYFLKYIQYVIPVPPFSSWLFSVPTSYSQIL